MFDGSLPEIADLASLTDAELVDAAGGWARAENAAGARKLAVMAEIFSRRTGLDAGERELWWIDPDAAVAAELAAALNVSTGMALHQTHRGIALRDRLPEVAALFAAGLVSGSAGAHHRVAHLPDRRRRRDGRGGRRAGRACGALGCVVGEEDRGRHRRAGRRTRPRRAAPRAGVGLTGDGPVRLTDRCGGHHDDLGAAELRGRGVDRAERRGDGAQRL